MLEYLLSFLVVYWVNLANDRKDGEIFAGRRRILIASVVRLYIAMIVTWWGIEGFDFTLNVLYGIFVFSPYLSRESRLSSLISLSMRRPWYDLLISSSAMYLVAALLAYYFALYHIGILCAATFVGSSMYHRHAEMKYFNLDNIFATSLLAFYTWAMWSSYYFNETFFLAAILGNPVAGFLLVYCGMPADIEFNERRDCCIRTSRPLYASIHTLWHLISGLGPILSVVYFHSIKCPPGAEQCPNLSADETRWKEIVVAIVALTVGLSINISGNLAGIMPLD